MRFVWCRLAWLMAVSALCVSLTNAQPIVRDTMGHSVALSHPAHRIIALAPNLAEIVYAAGAGKYLVGVSVACDYPKAVQKVPVVASANGLDLEKIVALQPDVVLVWASGNAMGQVARLKQLGIPAYVARFQQISDIPKVIEDVGRLAGTEAKALQSAHRFKQQYRVLKARYAHRKKVTIFYQISRYPLMTLNQQSLVSQAIALCGGRNIFTNATGLVPHVSMGAVLARNPQIIFVSTLSHAQKSWHQIWARYPMLKAVHQHAVYAFPAELIERYGPRMLAGVRLMCVKIDRVRDRFHVRPSNN